MNRIIKLAWRNIWRNKRRTLITAASIFFAVFFAVLMRSIQLGSYGHMISQSIEKFSGYLQLQNPEYFDEPMLDNFIEYTPELEKAIHSMPELKAVVPRIETFILASTGHQSKAIMLTGIDPVKEAGISNPESRLVKYRLTPEIVADALNKHEWAQEQIDLLKLNETNLYNSLDRLALDLALKPADFADLHHLFDDAKIKGEYLKPNDEGILLSSRLARFLRADVGDTVVMLGQGLYGTTAAGVFPVRGLVKLASPDLDNKLVYMSLNQIQQLLDMDNKLTSLVMNLNDTDEMLEVQNSLNAQLDKEQYVVKNWEEINPTLKQQIEGDDKSGQMFIGILYFIIFFGIFGTVMMMIAERKREFGVLVAIGMRKRKLAMVVVFEMIFIGILGTVTGMLAGIPMIVNFYRNPVRITGETAKMYEDMGFEAIMPTAPIDSYFTTQGIIIFVMVLLACVIPLQRIRKMKVMDNLRA